MAITRLGLNGYGNRLTGNFSGKAESGAVRPVGKITRLGLNGYVEQRAGDFSGKTPDSGGGEHPVDLITRLSLNGFAARRVGLFSGKEESAAISVIQHGGDSRGRKRKVYRTEEVYRALQGARKQVDLAELDEGVTALELFEKEKYLAEIEDQVKERLAKSVKGKFKDEVLSDFVSGIRFGDDLGSVPGEDMEKILLILLIDEWTNE